MKQAILFLRFLHAAKTQALSLGLMAYLGSSNALQVGAQQVPIILVQPAHQTVSAGSEVTFTVSALGGEPLSYQWRKEGTELVAGGKVSGATGTALTISNAQGNDMGAYSVIVRNDSGEVKSAEAILSIAPFVSWGGSHFGAEVIPSELGNVVSFDAGSEHTLVVRADGTVAAWGENDYGQCDVPPGLTDVRAVATGGKHSLALLGDGTAVGWGLNNFGQATIPPGLNHVVGIAAGSGHSLVLMQDGSVVAWGSDRLNQATVPEGLSSVVAISAGTTFSMALRANGTVVSWGAFDILGRYDAVVPEGLSNVVAIAAGWDHALAMLADRTVVAWGGENYYGQTDVPPGLTNVVQIDAGAGYSLALKMDGSLVIWSGREIARYMKPPPGLSHVVAISAGNRYILALVDPAYYPRLSIRREAGNVALSWTGGRGPFQVIQRTNLFLLEEWENVGPPVETNAITLPIDADVRFLRVLDLAPPRP
jgi:hypothetical protein